MVEKEPCPCPAFSFQAIWGDSLTQGGHFWSSHRLTHTVYLAGDREYQGLVSTGGPARLVKGGLCEALGSRSLPSVERVLPFLAVGVGV